MRIATRRMATAAVLGLAMVAGMAGRAKAGLIEIADRKSISFVSLQLRGLGFNALGEEVEVFVFDMSDDETSFAKLTITNVDTAATIYDRTFGPDVGNFLAPGTADETFILPYNVPLRIEMSGREQSRVALFLGGSQVAEGNEDIGDASFATTLTITAPVAVPEPSTLISGGLAGAVGLGLAWRHRRRARTAVAA